jgi:hypothetical protein
MKRHAVALSIWILAVLIAAVPSFAQRGRGAGGPPPNANMPTGMDRGPFGMGAPGMDVPSHGTMAPSHPSQSVSAISHSSPTDVLGHNTAIADKINSLTGQDAQTACSGFKNLGQCIAAAHVAKNLDIPGGFDALKAKITGSHSESLGKAIHGFKPNVNAKLEVKKANKQMAQDLKGSAS